MSITRKDFFLQAFHAAGKTVLEITGIARGSVPVTTVTDCDVMPPLPAPDNSMVAVPDNTRCLARNCGCLACVERCEPEAIVLVPGVGIKVDMAICTGCGTCEYVCPVSPKAVFIKTRADRTNNT